MQHEEDMRPKLLLLNVSQSNWNVHVSPKKQQKWWRWMHVWPACFFRFVFFLSCRRSLLVRCVFLWKTAGQLHTKRFPLSMVSDGEQLRGIMKVQTRQSCASNDVRLFLHQRVSSSSVSQRLMGGYESSFQMIDVLCILWLIDSTKPPWQWNLLASYPPAWQHVAEKRTRLLRSSP